MLTLLLALPLAHAPLPAPPAAAVYRVEQRITQEVDATALGQRKTTNTLQLVAFISASVSDSAGGRAVRAVLDSLTVLGQSPFTAAAVDSLRGTEFRGFQDANGKLGRITPVRTSGLTELGGAMISHLFPTARPRARGGDSWVDTTEQRSAESTAVTRRSIATYTLRGDEPRGGLPATRLEATLAASTSGKQGSGQMAQTVDGKGEGKGLWFLRPDGLLAESNVTESMLLKVSGAFAPEPIPVQLTQETTVTRLR